MRISRARLGWAFAAVVTGVGVFAWPLATGAGVALSLAAVFAGLRAAALAVLVVALVLAAAGLRVDADSRSQGDRSVPGRNR
ncbi:MAG: hypothetical protein ACR2GO_08445 [Candidatus Limnocylindria bacterium]